MTVRILLAACLLSAFSAGAEEPPRPAGAIQYTPDSAPWRDAPPAMPKGARIAVLEGDPAGEGLFTIRLKVPAGTALPVHTHPRPERVTVISGAALLGFGETPDRTAARRLPAGSFYVNPPDVPHFLFMDEETVMQITGTGPWQVRPWKPSSSPPSAP